MIDEPVAYLLGSSAPGASDARSTGPAFQRHRLEAADRKIRVNTVNPSPIDTPMIASLEMMRGLAGRNDQPMAAGTPLGRYGTPEEVAKLMLFLASDESSFCTGGVYMVDGGVSAGRRA